MRAVPDQILTWQMVQPAVRDAQSGEVTPGRLEQKALPVPELGPGEVLVQVAGCGICHTDLGFFYDGVPTVQKPPLTLGHEISGVVGFGMHKVSYSISRLMAFDAEIIGTWGCLPEYYPQVLELVLSGKIAVEPFVQTRPMSTIADAFAEAHHTPPEKRIVLIPDF